MEGSMIGWHIMEVDLRYIQKNDKVQFLTTVYMCTKSFLVENTKCLLDAMPFPPRSCC